MKIYDLCRAFDGSQFPTLGTEAHPERQSVLAARSAVTAAVIDDEFLADCISCELGLLESDSPRRGLMPFFTVPDLGIRFAFGYWPPGGTPGPHEHTAWTITAVCRNELEVITFDRKESYRRRELVQKNRFEAPAGRVGYIYEPCIHQPTNISNEFSLSLHISSPRDGEPPVDEEGPLPGVGSVSTFPSSQGDHPYRRVVIGRQRQECVRELARILAPMRVPEAPRLLERCSTLASSATRKMIDQIRHRTDRSTDPESQWLLARVHNELVLSHRDEGEMVALDVETEQGPREELVISSFARDAIDFVTKELLFEVRALPGNLSAEERWAIAEALEETGLYRRIKL